VWIAQGVTILKGTSIGEGSIVGAGCVVAGKKFAPRSLIVGNPARVVRQNVAWNRDMPANVNTVEDPNR
jgi:acetyltransferase-like isoleucine patch superfamily enzyme